MLSEELRKKFHQCFLCGEELEYNYSDALFCPHCKEAFTYDASHKVWKNHKIVDITYRDAESSCLSNLYRHPVLMKDGVVYQSMEAFFHGLCWSESKTVLEKEIAPLYGMDAWRIRYVLPDWRETQILHFDGHDILRESHDYQRLLREAYDKLFDQSAIFRLALQKTEGKLLMHSMGSNDPKETLLTSEEYMKMLHRERRRL